MRSFLCSTENGAENSTTQARTLDVVTEIKSGNNTVTYEYDKKRRVISVSLNDIGGYVSYAYSGDNTNAEKVTAKYVYALTAKPTNELHLLDCTCKLYAYDDNSDRLGYLLDEKYFYNPDTRCQGYFLY